MLARGINLMAHCAFLLRFKHILISYTGAALRLSCGRVFRQLLMITQLQQTTLPSISSTVSELAPAPEELRTQTISHTLPSRSLSISVTVIACQTASVVPSQLPAGRRLRQLPLAYRLASVDTSSAGCRRIRRHFAVPVLETMINYWCIPKSCSHSRQSTSAYR